MADVKLSELEAGTPTASDVTLAVYDPSGSPILRQVTVDNLRACILDRSPIKIGGINWYFQASSPGAAGVVGDLFSNLTDGKLYICVQNGDHWGVVGDQS